MEKNQVTLDSLFKFKYDKKINKFEIDKNPDSLKCQEDDVASSEDDVSSSVRLKNTKAQKKRVILSSSENSDVDEKEKCTKSNASFKETSSLADLYKMFPNVSQLKIRTIWKKMRFNVKEAVDCLLKEDFSNKQTSSSSSKTSPSSAESKISSNDSSPRNSKSCDKKKRKLEDKENFTSQPNLKKLRKLVDSDSEAESFDHLPKSKKKTKIKRICIESGDEEDIKEKDKNNECLEEKKTLSDTNSENDSERENSLLNEEETSLRNSIVSFFNVASIDELQSMTNTSLKRIETLVSMRPFSDFKNLEFQLSEKSLGFLIDTAREIIYARDAVNQLMDKCEQISNKLHELISACIDKSATIDVKSSSLKIKSQPNILNTNLSLKPYQLVGLNWMCLMSAENINGILADEMGLGKTIQAISFLAHLIETGLTGIHLVVVPPSTLDNWLREIETWCPSINYLVYTGSQEERRMIRYNILDNNFEKTINVLITTYRIISSTSEDKAFFKKIKFEYCIFDEAHMLKNMASIRYQSLIKIMSKGKLLLTGTPLQNNLVELMSLLNFVMPDIFNHKTHHIKKLFTTKTSKENGTFFNDKINQAKSIMKPFILRRLKNEVLQQLPKKHEKLIYCQMTEIQATEYKRLISNYIERSEDNKQLATKNKNNKMPPKSNEDSTSNIIMELRKAANHPLLRRNLYNDTKIREMANLILKESSKDTVLEYVIEDLSVMNDFEIHKLCSTYKSIKTYELTKDDILNSGKFNILTSILEEKNKKDEKVLIFSQFVIMLDIVEEFLKIKEYKYYRLDGSTPVEERQDLIDNYNEERDVLVFLLSTKAGGMGINLTSANIVILHDIDYNPFNDKQAEDRCHRVGQTKEVEIYKLISKDTIDETMLKIQSQKLELGQNLTTDTEESQSKCDMVFLLKEALKIKDI